MELSLSILNRKVSSILHTYYIQARTMASHLGPTIKVLKVLHGGFLKHKIEADLDAELFVL